MEDLIRLLVKERYKQQTEENLLFDFCSGKVKELRETYIKDNNYSESGLKDDDIYFSFRDYTIIDQDQIEISYMINYNSETEDLRPDYKSIVVKL